MRSQNDASIWKEQKKNDDDSINEGHQKRQPLLNSNYVFLPLMYLNTIGNEIKSNLLSVVCATHQGIFYRYNLCYRANKIMMMVSSRLIFFSRKKVMMYLIDHNIIRLFSLLLCPCSSLEVYFWPWWKLALSIFKQTQKDNEWQKQVVLLLHDGTDDMFFSKATIHNPLFYIQSLSRLSILSVALSLEHLLLPLTFNKKPFFRVFLDQDET